MQHLYTLREESSLLKMIRLQQSQCCHKAVAWLRKSSEFLEIYMNYSVYEEYFMDTVLYALFVSLESKALPWGSTDISVKHHSPLRFAYH